MTGGIVITGFRSFPGVADNPSQAVIEHLRASRLLPDGTRCHLLDVDYRGVQVDLADILEAAAVYSATVMGQDNFSRPRLLHLAAEAVDDLSREDGLRGFGQLLRAGTLRKVSRGTFALGSESRFAGRASRRAG